MPSKKSPRADGRFQEKLKLPDGKYKYFYGKTQKEAREKKNAFIRDMDKPKPVEDLTVREWAERWLPISSPNEVTRKGNKVYVDKIVGALGELPLAYVRKSDIVLLSHDAASKSFSYSRKMKSIVGRFFSDAMDNHLILSDPCRKVEWGYASKGSHRALKDWEKELISSNWDKHRCGIWAMLMLYAGLRRGEMLALTWEDVDFETDSISVGKSYSFIGNAGVLGSPKTEAGRRILPLLPPLRFALLALKNGDSTGQICGTKITQSYFKRGWSGYLHAMENVLNGEKLENQGRRTDKIIAPQRAARKIFSIRPHDLRHTYCTMLYEAGVGIKEAQYLMGHDDLKTTMEVYTHLSDRQTDAARRKLLKCFGETGVK